MLKSFQTHWCRGLGGEWQTGIVCRVCGSGYSEFEDEVVAEEGKLFSACDHCGQKTEIDRLPPQVPAEAA